MIDQELITKLQFITKKYVNDEVAKGKDEYDALLESVKAFLTAVKQKDTYNYFKYHIFEVIKLDYPQYLEEFEKLVILL